MNDLATEIHELALVLGKRAEAKLRPFGLTYRKYVALFIITEHPGLTSKDLATALGVTESAVSQMLKSLLDQDWVVDTRRQGDSNKKILSITHSGNKVLRKAGRNLGNSLDDHVEGLGIDVAELTTTLQTIRESL